MADIMTPTLGESVTEATVARWTKKAGDAVRKDEILVELETDKVSLEVASPTDGVLSEIAAEEGATVEPGAVLRPSYRVPGSSSGPSTPRRPPLPSEAAPAGEAQGRRSCPPRPEGHRNGRTAGPAVHRLVALVPAGTSGARRVWRRQLEERTCEPTWRTATTPP